MDVINFSIYHQPTSSIKPAMDKKGKKRGRVKYKNLKMSSTKEAFLVKEAFLITFQKFYFNGKNKKSEHKL